MVAVLNDPHAALITRSLAAGALRHFILSEVPSQAKCRPVMASWEVPPAHHSGFGVWGST